VNLRSLTARVTVLATSLVASAIFVVSEPAGANAAASPPDYTVIVSSGSTAPLQLFNNATRAPIVPAGAFPAGSQAAATSADGKLAYTIDQDGNLLTIDLATRAVLQSSPIGNGNRLILSPDGRYLYFNEADLRIDLVTGDRVGAFGRAWKSPILSPDGTLAFIPGTGPDGLSNDVVRVGGEQVDQFRIGTYLNAFLRNHDGSKIWAETSVGLVPFDWPTTHIDRDVSVTGEMAMSPDGSTVWVNLSGAEAVVPIDTATVTARASIPLPVRNSPTRAMDIAVTPDGGTVYALSLQADRGLLWLDVIDTKTSTVVTSRSIRGDFGSLAITPDQAPVARLKATTACPLARTIRLDASTSTVRYGTIATFDWTFGDGSTASTTTPTTSHQYARAGKYTTTVTETDSAGTSTTSVGDGRVINLFGGPGARASVTTDIPARCPVATRPPTSRTTPAPTPAKPASSPADELANSGVRSTSTLALTIVLISAGSIMIRLGRRHRSTRNRA